MRRECLTGLICLGMCMPLHAATMSYDLSIDTSGFAAVASEYQFDFILSGTAGNTVTVSNPDFGTGGSLLSGPVPIVLTSSISTFGGEATWLFTAGNTASFTLTTTDIGPTGSFEPDTILIALEDPTGNPYTTTDPDDALFRLTLTGGTDTPALPTGTEPPITGITFAIGGSTGTTGTTGTTGSTGGPGPTPEPATAELMTVAGLGVAALCLFARKR